MKSYPNTAKALGLGLVFALSMLVAWELFLRSENYPVAPDDNKGLWAYERAEVEELDSTGVVLLGSSRVLFNIQIHVWEELTGTKPIMLATPGSNPIPAFKDIVNNSSFNGILIVGITPPIYFSPLSMDNFSYARIANWVEHYHDRTYADRLNHLLSRIPQNYLAFLNSTEEEHYNELALRTLIGRAFMPDNRAPGPPPFPMFNYVDYDRNVTMLKVVSSDTSYARGIKNFWEFVIQPPPNAPSPEKAEELRKHILDVNMKLVEKFRSRGGRVVFIRNPSQNKFLKAEKNGFPRDRFWDPLVDSTATAGYHFEDYEFMNRYTLPEWSHLATPDARRFTRDLVNQMQSDGVLR